MQIKQLFTGAAVAATLATSTTAMAELSGNIGVTSEYYFRGLTQSAGAAVQGGVDYAAASGFYAGMWGSNVSFAGAGAGGAEVDLYGGYAFEAGPVGIDLGALYYWYPEEDETGTELSTLEISAGFSFGPASLGYAYSDELKFFGVTGANGEYGEGGYLSLGIELPISEKASVAASIGQYSGQAIEDYLASVGSTDDAYVDYGLSLNLAASDEIGVSFGFVGTDIDTGAADDDLAFVASASYGFGL